MIHFNSLLLTCTIYCVAAQKLHVFMQSRPFLDSQEHVLHRNKSGNLMVPLRSCFSNKFLTNREQYLNFTSNYFKLNTLSELAHNRSLQTSPPHLLPRFTVPPTLLTYHHLRLFLVHPVLKTRGGFLKEIAVASQRLSQPRLRLSQLRQNRSCPFLKTAKRFSKKIIRIAVCDIAANQVTEIRLYIFKYHGDIFQ